MNIYFYSDIDYILEVENETYDLLSGFKQLVSTDNEKFFMKFFPKSSKNALPIFCEFELKNDSLVSSSNLVSCYKINHENFFVKVSKNEFTEFKTLCEYDSEKKSYQLIQDELLILKVCDKEVWKKNVVSSSAKIYENFGLIFCEINSSKNNVVVVLDEKDNVLLEDEISFIEFNENSFSTLLELNDTQKHGIVKKYRIQDEVFSREQCYTVYLENSVKKLANNNLTHIVFFECVKAGNYKLAKSFLSEELSLKVNSAHLKSYFGDFDEVLDATDIFNKIAVLLVDSKEKNVKCFSLEIKNGNIYNIENAF